MSKSKGGTYAPDPFNETPKPEQPDPFNEPPKPKQPDPFDEAEPQPGDRPDRSTSRSRASRTRSTSQSRSGEIRSTHHSLKTGNSGS